MGFAHMGPEVNNNNKQTNKNKQKTTTSSVLQGLFRNFGDCLLPLLKPHLERMISDTSFDKHESNNRCAMEIISGLVRGSKHWNYEQVCTHNQLLFRCLVQTKITMHNNAGS